MTQLTLSKKINNLGKIPENSVLVTMHVRSLYTNIPHEKAIKTVDTAFKRKIKDGILFWNYLILTLNNFTSTAKTIYKNYLQITPTYINIFMRMFEENYIYHLIQEKCKLYLT